MQHKRTSAASVTVAGDVTSGITADNASVPSVLGGAPVAHFSKAQRRAFLPVLFLVGTSNYIDKNIIGVLLEQIKGEFHVSDSMLGMLSGISFALFYATFGIPIARWADHGNRKRIITVSLMVWSLMTMLCGVASTFWQLAAARFGVGAGEAGAIPPAQSLLADYYPPAERARAIGIFMMSATVGYAVALVLGGWITEHYGWRATFLVVGLLGLALAPIVHFVLKEPRISPRFAGNSAPVEPIFTTIRVLMEKSAYRNMLISIVGYFLMSYGAMVFIVSLMMRAHGLTVSQAGTAFGVVSAIGALVGNLGGGMLADRLAASDSAWHTRLAGWGMIAAVPLYEIALDAPSITVMIPALVLATIMMWAVIPPMFAALHLVCGARRRAMAIAVVFFFANLIGLGLGPVLAGTMSDIFAVTYGPAEGLRYALMAVVIVFVPAGYFMLRASRHVKAEAEA